MAARLPVVAHRARHLVLDVVGALAVEVAAQRARNQLRVFASLPGRPLDAAEGLWNLGVGEVAGDQLWVVAFLKHDS